MSSSDSLTHKWLRQNIHVYANKDRVFADVDAVLTRNATLRPKTDIYTFDDGRTQLLLCLHGLLPISYRQSSYHIPVAIWVSREYPRAPPLAYVVPTSDMLVRPGKYMDVSGRCNIEYLQHWERKSEGCDLASLVEAMQGHFSREPPVYSKPKQSGPVESRSSPHPSTSDYAARPSPPVPAQAVSPLPHTTPSPGAPDRPALPPKPPSSISPALVPVVTHHLPPFHHPLNGTSPPPARYQTPPVPPKPPLPPALLPLSGPSQPAHSLANQPAHNSSTSVGIFPPQSPPPLQAQGSVPSSSHRWSLPPNPPPPIPQGPSGVVPQTIVTASPGPVSPPPPFNAYGIPPTTQPPPQFSPPIGAPPAPAPRNLLDEEAADDQSAPAIAAPIAAPPRPPNPELLNLHAHVHAKLTSELASLSQAMAIDAERLRAHQADLLAGEPTMRDEMARLEAVRDVCRGVVERMRGTVDQAERNVAELKRKGDPPVDELVCSTSIVHNQLIDLIAEDNAIEDTVYHLHRALNAGRMDLDRFIRTTRVLAEEQFMKRALIEKIQAAIPMGVSLGAGWS